MDIWALIPVKSLLDSKRRLSHLLLPEQRADLICDLLERELCVLEQVPDIASVLVISSDPKVWDLARKYGALVEEEQQSFGLNLAVTRGMEVAVSHGASALLVLPVDLPYVSASDVTQVIRSMLEGTEWDRDTAKHPGTLGNNGISTVPMPGCKMVICSDEEGDGTNALMIQLPQAFTFQFGAGSFQNHIREGEKRGMIVYTVTVPGLGFDIDNESDWFTYQASKVGC